MRIVLHPGMQKAGSTTLQLFFRENEAAFLSAGVAYFEPADAKSLPPMPEQILAAVDALQSGPHADSVPQIVVSHEGLLEVSKPDVSRLVESLADRGHSIDVVCVVRPVRDWVVSREKQRLRTLKGHGRPRSPRAEMWFASWFDDDVNRHLAAPMTFLDLTAEGGLARGFLDAARLPLPEGVDVHSVVARNTSDTGRDLALYYVLDKAIATTARGSEDGVELLRDANLLESTRLLRTVMRHGDHHRTPRSLGLEPELREELIIHFVREIGSLLRKYADSDPKQSKRVAGLLEHSVALLKSGPRADRVTLRYEEEFYAGVEAVIRPTEEVFVAWCERVGASQLAEIMTES